MESLYTIRRIVQHVIETEERHWKHIRLAIDTASTTQPAHSGPISLFD